MPVSSCHLFLDLMPPVSTNVAVRNDVKKVSKDITGWWKLEYVILGCTYRHHWQAPLQDHTQVSEGEWYHRQNSMLAQYFPEARGMDAVPCYMQTHYISVTHPSHRFTTPPRGDTEPIL